MSEPLRLELLRAALAVRIGPVGGRAVTIGRRIEFHPRIGSTNDRARELAASGEPEGTVVVADEQTHGRGRAGRSWHSPPGLGLYLSILLRPEAAPEQAPLLGLLAAVVACAAVRRLGVAQVGIEWPNDLIAIDPRGRSRRKLAGVLTEARTSPEAIRDLVIGVGVNVNQEERDFPPGMAPRATSLRILAGRLLDRERVAAEILTAFDEWYTLWGRDGDAPVLDAFRSMALDLEGRRVRVVDGSSAADAAAAWLGTTAGLAPDGALRVLPDGGGEAVAIRYGDVTRVQEA